MRNLFVLFCLLPVIVFSQKKKQVVKYGTVQLIFTNLVNGNPLVLNDSVYTNPFGENYTISKLKYYISNITLGKKVKNRKSKVKNSYYLINQADPASLTFSLTIPEGDYNNIHLLPGVDSARNCSGAQTGALDPLNDMFWTWNTGYVMEKIEGRSPQSNMVNNKVEYHIGGFKGANSVLQPVVLAFTNDKILEVRKGKTSIIRIDAELDKLWQGNIDLKIGDTPSCGSPGQLAKQIAANFAGIFTIAAIINPN